MKRFPTTWCTVHQRPFNRDSVTICLAPCFSLFLGLGKLQGITHFAQGLFQFYEDIRYRNQTLFLLTGRRDFLYTYTSFLLQIFPLTYLFTYTNLLTYTSFDCFSFPMQSSYLLFLSLGII